MEKPAITYEMHAIFPVAVVLPSVVVFIRFSVHLDAFRKQMVAQTGEGVKGNGEQIKQHLHTIPSSPGDHFTTLSNLKVYSTQSTVCKLTSSDGGESRRQSVNRNEASKSTPVKQCVEMTMTLLDKLRDSVCLSTLTAETSCCVASLFGKEILYLSIFFFFSLGI